jgi:hypothetical protein
MLVTILSLPVSSYAFGTNSQTPFAGAPGQGTCASCHGSLGAASSINVNAPATYSPGGAAITLTVTIPTAGGFELEVGTQASNAQAGTLAAGTQDLLTTNGALQFVTASAETTSWTFNWTPPATNVGNVVVYVTGGTHNTNYSNSFVIMAPAAAAPDFSLSALPISLAITDGGASASSTISVNKLNNFSGTVAFTASGAPAGVTASVSSTGTLTVAATTATAATFPITVTGTSTTPSLTHTTTVNVTVSAAATPNFSLSANPSSLTIAQGAGGMSTINVASSGGFSGAVTYSVSGLPSGVMASFTNNVLTLSATGTATAGGPTAITITGTSASPSLSRITTVNLTVSSGTVSPTLSSNPPSLSFTYQIGGALPASKTVSISSTGGSTSFTATETDPWLSISPKSGTGTPAPITASLNSAGLAGLTVGSHGAQINITSAGGKTLTVNVSLMVTAASGGGGGTTGNLTAQAYVSDTQSGALAAAWVNYLGTSPNNASDPLNRALVLSKGASAPTNGWAGAIIQNVTGMSLTEVGFDFNADIQCSKNTVHFIITIAGGTSHTVGGCTNSPTITTQSAGPAGWTRLRFDPSLAGIAPTDHVQSISIELGNGSGTTGSIAVIDNIYINGAFIGKGSSTSTSRSRDD